MTKAVECGMTVAVKAPALACARYWRNTLADAELGRGALGLKDAGALHPISPAALSTGRVGLEVITALFTGDRAEAESIAITLRPLVYRSRTEHGRISLTLPAVVTPIVSKATLMRDGRVVSPVATVVPRDLLEPLDHTAFTIGTVDALDGFLTRNGDGPETPADDSGAAPSWDAYREHCRLLVATVFPELTDDKRFERNDGGLIGIGDGQRGASQSIGALYDRIAKDEPAAPLFENFASQPDIPPEPCLSHHAMFAQRLGHSSDRYALADAQREALAHLLAAHHGEVVAVNGPPGTGKTTLLLSVVACLWIEAAIAGGEPPIILAASTNNQAVTNIIDAFGSDFATGVGPFAGRWLPVDSFGSYFPAASKRKEAEKRGYLIQAFFAALEQPQPVEQARAAYLDAARLAFPHAEVRGVNDAVALLHARLVSQTATLAAIETTWNRLADARVAISAALGHDHDATIAALREDASRHRALYDQAERLADTWDSHQAAESIFLALFGWLPAVAAKRVAKARSLLRPHWTATLPTWTAVTEVAPAISRIVADAAAARQAAEQRLAAAEALLESGRAGLEHWCDILAPLGIGSDRAQRTTLADCDPLADRMLRFPLFQTATHYWEGRWLLDMAAIPDPADEQKRKGRKVLSARWRRWMKLTPCAVSTFYALPDAMRARRKEDGVFIDDFLYDTADLLIVDEAGQVPPEVGGAAFALARRALVIGDSAQIEPIWNVPRRVDTGNLLDAGLLSQEDEREERRAVERSGRAAASGSVMQIAQHVSRYHPDPDLARGLMLYEHRRCFDEIVGYCNDLCYAGKLKPLRGSKALAATDPLPAMGYLHIDGRCEPLTGGSRRNIAEAETIAAWIAAQRAMLETAYPDQPLEAIIGIATPFAAQVRAIRTALQKAGIDATPGGKGETIGSVHAFQGGQRPVMLFSPVYSKHADGAFIDSSRSMLNVAVSRAMNSFLVFGDMDCFSNALASSPRGRLARVIFADDANALSFSPVERYDLARRSRIEHLRDAADHDRFLREVLAATYRDIHIVTPWLTWRALRDADLTAPLAAAVAQGKTLTIYTDPALNDARIVTNAAAQADLARALTALQTIGATIVEVHQVHSKVVMADDEVYCVGSFNWLSAARTGALARHETSLAYHGKAVAGDIDAMKASLQHRAGPRSDPC